MDDSGRARGLWCVLAGFAWLVFAAGGAAAAPDPLPDAPRALIDTLTVADRAIDILDGCSRESSPQARQAGRSWDRFYAIGRTAEGIWGQSVVDEADQVVALEGLNAPVPHDCGRQRTARALAGATGGLDRADALLAETIGGMNEGTWFGIVRLCPPPGAELTITYDEDQRERVSFRISRNDFRLVVGASGPGDAEPGAVRSRTRVPGVKMAAGGGCGTGCEMDWRPDGLRTVRFPHPRGSKRKSGPRHYFAAMISG